MKDTLVIILGTLSACFAGSYFFVLIKSRKLKKDLAKLFIEKTLLQEYANAIKDDSSKISSEEYIHKENFIKFLSDSRDWAYKYIEDVQKGLNSFVSDVDPAISHFDEYGEALSMSRPDYSSMKSISTAYKELKKLLPEDEIK